jgi:hypothetical protein
MEINTELEFDASGQIHLDPTMTTLTGAASLEAYTDYAKRKVPHYVPPQLNYGSRPFLFIDRFTGFDDVLWGSGQEERFGVIYQWTARPDVYLIAFRGTVTPYDMVMDIESGATSEFKPYAQTSNFPSPVHVGDGFNKIYANKNSQMSQSMQEQLFYKLSKLSTTPKQIIITGHSLGCSLGTLFALDMAVSMPNVDIFNMNFASPRVGVHSFYNAYNHYGLANKTIRVRNLYDLVPKVPFSDWPFDFKHVGLEFDLSFTLDTYAHLDFPAIVDAWHSLLNYRYVLDQAVVASPQVWTGPFDDQAHPGWGMTSVNPYLSISQTEMNAIKQLRVDNDKKCAA